MPLVIGYLRHYTRWNGQPGLTMKEQRGEVNRIARWLDLIGYGRRYFEETSDGAINGWPMLREAISQTEHDVDLRTVDDVDLETVLVIPTLDGVRLNLQFLDIIADN